MRGLVARGSLVLAAATFWLAWWLMPDAGTNDAAHILEAIGQNREDVFYSAIVQLISSALFAPALLHFGAISQRRGATATFIGAALLLVGAMGMAADAVYHQAAYQMAAPDLDKARILPALERMQTEDIRTLIPLLLAFFVGTAVFSVGLARAGLVAGWIPRLVGAAFGVAILGGVLSAHVGLERHLVVLTFLGLISLALAAIGVTVRDPSATGAS